MDLNNSATTFFASLDEKLILIEEVTKFHDNGGKGNRLMALTDKGIHYLDGKPPVYKLNRSAKWIDLKQIVDISQLGGHLIFDNNLQFKFQTNKGKRIASYIIDIVQKLLNKDDLKKVNFPNFEIFHSEPTQYSTYLRFLEISRVKKYEIVPKDKDVMRDLMMFNFKYIDLSLLSPWAINPFLKAIATNRNIQSIFCQKAPKVRGYSDLKNFVETGEYNVNHLHVSGFGFCTDFKRMLDGISKNPKNKINSLTFSVCPITDNEIKPIVKCVEDAQLNCLGLVGGALQRPQFQSFLGALAGPSSSSLVMLTFDGTPGLPLQLVANSFNNLMSLSVAGCGLDVFESLSIISSMTNLRSVNLSQNPAQYKDNFVLPPALSTIVVDDVEWNEKSLAAFMLNCLAAGGPIRISVSSAVTGSAGWKAVTKSLQDADFSGLDGLSWCSNPIDVLLSFISRATSLKLLNASDCVKADNCSQFIDSIRNLTELRTLVLQGGDSNQLGSAASQVIELVREFHQIACIDLSKNKAGDQLLDLVPGLIEANSHLTCICLDKNGFTAGGLEKLGSELWRLNANIVSFPYSDYKTNKEDKKADQIALANALGYWQRLQLTQFSEHSEKEVQNFDAIEKPWRSPLDGPFDVFVSPPMEAFPDFIPPEVVKQLRQTPPTPRTPTKSPSPTKDREKKKREKAEEETPKKDKDKERKKKRNDEEEYEETPKKNHRRKSSNEDEEYETPKKERRKKVIDNDDDYSTPKKERRKKYAEDEEEYETPKRNKDKKKRSQSFYNDSESESGDEERRERKKRRATDETPSKKPNRKHRFRDSEDEDRGGRRPSLAEGLSPLGGTSPSLVIDQTSSNTDSEDRKRAKYPKSQRHREELSSSDGEDPVVWGYVLPLAPTPDISSTVEKMNEEYSLVSLLRKLKRG